jgi:purine-cytosine permease-like protein
VLEAVLGVILIAALVGRIVGMLISQFVTPFLTRSSGVAFPAWVAIISVALLVRRREVELATDQS